MRKIGAGIIIAMVVGLVMGGGTAGATESEACYEQIPTVQIEKHTRERTRDVNGQHYSFTGGKRATWDAPTFPGADGD